MNILTILGSPRRKGNTAGALDMVEHELTAAYGHLVERLILATVNVNGCMGCQACQKVADRPGCVQKDDAVSVFERMIAADALIYGSPLYCWDFTAQMKALIDRHFCLVTGYGTARHHSLIAGKPTALLVTCAGPVKGNADVIQTVFDRVWYFLPDPGREQDCHSFLHHAVRPWEKPPVPPPANWPETWTGH
jgi:multimeric flavodoxin WrbA